MYHTNITHNTNLTFDQGYCFGMGIFETIAVEQGKPLFLSWHLERMKKGLHLLEITNKNFQTMVTEQSIQTYLKEHFMMHGVLKIMVSENNILFTTRENPYGTDSYDKGFHLGISKVKRNDTSIFSYVKSFHYGDNLLEKRNMKKNGYDEALFFNTKNQLTETTASNIFFVKNGTLYTPKTECGLLDGIVRRYLLETYPVQQLIIKPEDIATYEEVFLTNSLMGIMPVAAIEQQRFDTRTVTMKIKEQYEKDCIAYI